MKPLVLLFSLCQNPTRPDLLFEFDSGHPRHFELSIKESLPPEVEVTHVNLNDRCVEDMRHRTLPIISVQYHPEAASGPHDAEHHFRRFIELMEKKGAAT